MMIRNLKASSKVARLQLSTTFSAAGWKHIGCKHVAKEAAHGLELACAVSVGSGMNKRQANVNFRRNNKTGNSISVTTQKMPAVQRLL